MAKRGRPPKISDEQRAVLVQIVQSSPTATLAEVETTLHQRTGIKAHPRTIYKYLRAAGVERQRASAALQVERASAPPRRYGYTAEHRRQAPEQTYPSCLTDAEWTLVQDLFENAGGRGTPPRSPRRLLVDACCYVVRSGCAWRLLPTGFPPWQNVYRTFRRWSAQGKFEQLHDRLRTQWHAREGHAAAPTAALLNAQSTRSSPPGGEHGYDAGKKIKGRKRHLVVDALGLLLAVSVSAASVQDRDSAAPATAMAKYPSVETLFVDSAYAGQCANKIAQDHGVAVQVVRYPANQNVGRWCVAGSATVAADARGFVVLPLCHAA